jgi:hypothetical protein
MLQKHFANVEDTDGLVIRFPLDDMIDRGILKKERGQIKRPSDQDLVVYTRSASIATSSEMSAALSLFLTCPEFPQAYAMSGGVLTINKLTISADPVDTGEGEVLAGTLTATLTRANAKGPVGSLRAVFDFPPPRRPLTDFK